MISVNFIMDKRIDIMYEDDNIIVCHKFSGIAVQSASIGSPDMVTELKKYMAEKANGIKGKQSRAVEPYIAVIHRLDQPVEGILVFARDKRSAGILSKQASGESPGMEKLYRAVVYGHMKEKSGKLSNYLLKDGRTNSSAVVSKAQGGKLAELEYEVVDKNQAKDESDDKTECVNIKLLSGRHHQIRVQLSYAGVPIVGDLKYGNEESKAYAKEKGIRQLCLCAYHLTFRHPADGKKMDFILDGT